MERPYESLPSIHGFVRRNYELEDGRTFKVAMGRKELIIWTLYNQSNQLSRVGITRGESRIEALLDRLEGLSVDGATLQYGC